MGNSTSSNKQLKKPTTTKKKSKHLLCCPCTFSKSYSSTSSLSIDEHYLPTFDRLASNDKSPLPVQNSILLVEGNRRSVSLSNVLASVPDSSKPLQSKPPLPPGKSITTSKLPPVTSRSFRGTLANTKRTYYSQSIEHARLSIEDLEKSLHGASSIDQWIDSLPILGTPSLNRNKANLHLRTVTSSSNTHKKIKRSRTIGDECDENILNGSYQQASGECGLVHREAHTEKNDFIHVLTLMKSSRDHLHLAREIHLNVHLNDFLTRLTNTKCKQTFKNHFSLARIIYPFAGIDQVLADDLTLFYLTPSESILPHLSSNMHSHYKIHEQIRSKCYFVPMTHCKIEVNDEEYQRKSIELDRTHVVITIETKTKDEPTTTTKKAPPEPDASYVFHSDDGFRTGWIRLESDKLAKHFLPFVFYSTEDETSSLSSTLIQQWFHTLMLVNQTCAIAKRFLTGDGSHITCLLKPPTAQENNLTFAALRLPPCMYLNDSTNIDLDEERAKIVDAFSSTFLSDNTKTSNDIIHIDYEQYSFALLLHRWPKSFLDHYDAQSTRSVQRKWPSKYHMNIIVKKPILLIPVPNEHRWETNFDLIEQSLFELMNHSTLCLYALCQQLYARTPAMRTCIKHCFLNYCERYGLPASSQREQANEHLQDFLSQFLHELQSGIQQRFLPNYFNHEINLLLPSDDYTSWFDHIQKCAADRLTIPPSPTSISNRPIIVEFLFHFIDQLYQTFHIKRSQFHLSETVLLDLHKQLCEKLSNDTNNNSTLLQKFINHLLNNTEIIEHIQTNLTYAFETNAELVHTCLNQVRKADSSLIFHYTWTIYVQYLHTYYNVLWNI